MQTDFNSRIHQARRRISVNLVLSGLSAALLVAAIAAAVVVLLQKTVAVTVPPYPLAGSLAGVVILWTLVTWYVHRPTVPQAALAIDERMALRERFSTALALAKSEDPFAVAAREDTYRHAAGLKVGRDFPVTVGRRWIHTGSTWGIVGLVFLLMPNLDLLGRQAEASRLADEQARAQQAAVDVQNKVKKVEALVKKIDDPALAAELAKLPEFKLEAQTPEINREALRKLGDLATQLQNLTDGEKADTERMLSKMLRQMKMPTQGLSKKFAQALARGKFNEAAQALGEMQEKLNSGEMSPEEKEAIEKEFQKLAQQLKDLAAQQKELQDALAQAGLSKELASATPQQLQQAMQKAGLSSDTMQRLLQKQQASQSASQAASQLAQALSKCAGGQQGQEGQPGQQGQQGMSPSDMAALGDQLSQLEAMQQQLASARAALSELQNGMAMLGAQIGSGTGDYSTGLSDKRGQGTGGPGKGFGERDTSLAEATNNSATRVPNKTADGPIIATWYSQEEQLKGETAAKFQEAARAGRDRAAEAIRDNAIPARYNGPLQDYFDQLNATRKPDAPK
jgi:hypothetical protein